MIYFDNAATTFPKPEEVYQAVDNANRNYAFNAGRGTYNSIVFKRGNVYCIPFLKPQSINNDVQSFRCG